MYVVDVCVCAEALPCTFGRFIETRCYCSRWGWDSCSLSLLHCLNSSLTTRVRSQHSIVLYVAYATRCSVDPTDGRYWDVTSSYTRVLGPTLANFVLIVPIRKATWLCILYLYMARSISTAPRSMRPPPPPYRLSQRIWRTKSPEVHSPEMCETAAKQFILVFNTGIELVRVGNRVT